MTTTPNAVTSQTAQSSPIIDLPVWKTIKLGTGFKTADDFRAALRNDYLIDDVANDIIGKPAFVASESEMEVELVILTPAKLGLEDGATRKDIYDRALECGVTLCPSEVSPQLCLQYKDQPKGECLVIASEPIIDSDGDPAVFYMLRARHGRWLHASHGGSDIRWNSDDLFVFTKPRK
jgi:hypothetical protein